jgi:alkanesulfonate monooxygenase SsuD/methylene tetrahydromethanopterin reductase-like flavin-dependent oxidoreductase (luciferase family)
MTLDQAMSELAAKGSESVKKLWLKHGAKEPFFGVKIGELAKKPLNLAPATFADAGIANDDAALIGTPEEIGERLQKLADGGVEYVLLTNATASRESLVTFSEKIMPHVRSRAPAVALAAA